MTGTCFLQFLTLRHVDSDRSAPQLALGMASYSETTQPLVLVTRGQAFIWLASVGQPSLPARPIVPARAQTAACGFAPGDRISKIGDSSEDWE